MLTYLSRLSGTSVSEIAPVSKRVLNLTIALVHDAQSTPPNFLSGRLSVLLSFLSSTPLRFGTAFNFSSHRAQVALDGFLIL